MLVKQNKLCLVTGGTSGIGKAIVLSLLDSGYSVILTFRQNKQEADNICKKFGDKVYAASMDLGNPSSLPDIASIAKKQFGQGIDILVNNAGGWSKLEDFMDSTLQIWNETINLNLTSTYVLSKMCVPWMKNQKWGRIINMSSISARTGGGKGGFAYVAAKAGLEGLTRAMAKELAPDNITVNSIAPGVIQTPLHDKNTSPEAMQKLINEIPLSRAGSANEVASMVKYLISKEAGYITGETLAINGGKRFD